MVCLHSRKLKNQHCLSQTNITNCVFIWLSSADLETRLYRDIESVVVGRRGELNKDPETVALIELFSLEVFRPKNVQGYNHWNQNFGTNCFLIVHSLIFVHTNKNFGPNCFPRSQNPDWLSHWGECIGLGNYYREP